MITPDGFESVAFDLVVAAEHPSPENGGPCATCAFRRGTEANLSPHTTMLAKLCVEGLRLFDCHERPQLCRGYIAAVNIRGVPQDTDDEHLSIVAGWAADILAQCIASAKAVDAVREDVTSPLVTARDKGSSS